MTGTINALLIAGAVSIVIYVLWMLRTDRRTQP
jgi:hypothetical protein